jgi:hypothetical protein
MKPLLFLLAISTPLAAQVAGTWNLTLHPDLPSLIELATESLAPSQRSHAREVLKTNNVAYRRIAITHDGGQIAIQFDQRRPQRMRDDAFAVPWAGEDGKNYLISARMEGEDLVQTLMGEDGMRKIVFHASQGVLTLKVTVKAMLLPKPFRYTLVYHS